LLEDEHTELEQLNEITSWRSCLDRFGTGAAELDIEIEEAAQTGT